MPALERVPQLLARLANRPYAASFLIGLCGTLYLLLLPSTFLEGFDFYRMHLPFKSYFRAAILEGEFPWWNPYSALGRPFFADVETAVLYPFNWLVLPFGVGLGCVLIVFCHLWLAAEGVLRLADRWGLRSGAGLVGATAFCLSGFLIARLQVGQFQVFCALCWWPWLFWGASRLSEGRARRNIVRLAAIMLFAYLAGSPPFMWVAGLGLGLFVLAAASSFAGAIRELSYLAAAVVLCVALSAIQFFSFVELVAHGNRALDSAAFALDYGQTFNDWLGLLVPPSVYFPVGWEANHYVGLVTLLLGLAALGKLRAPFPRAACTCLVFGALLAVGRDGFLLEWLVENLPGFSGLRLPSRYGVLASFGLILLAMVGWDRWVVGLRAKGVVFAMHCVLLCLGVSFQESLYRPYNKPPPIGAEKLDRLVDQTLPARNQEVPYRVAIPTTKMGPNAGMMEGFSTISFFANPSLSRTWRYCEILAGRGPEPFHLVFLRDETLVKVARGDRTADLLVRYLPEEGGVQLRASEAPRAFLSSGWDLVDSFEEAAVRLREGHNFVDEPLVETAWVDALPPRSEGAAAPAEISQFSRNTVTVKPSGPGRGLLVLGEAWFPGWRAKADGLESLVFPVNAWQRAVFIEGGVEAVRFHY
jgi:hypothetical protein